MNLYDLRDFVGGLAIITTIFQFLSGVLVCKQYVKNRTTAEASPLPFLSGVLSTTLWLLYGLTKNDNRIVLVNVIGLILMTAYTVVFYMFTYKKSSTSKQIFITIACILFTLGYMRVETDEDFLLDRLGKAACILTLLTIAAPMSKLFYVLRVKCTECLPFPMILTSFFVSSLWYVYGVIERDRYLQTPNLCGCALALIQLSLFCFFPRTPQSPLLPKSIQA